MVTNALYLQCLAAGLLGVLFHVFAIKIPAVRKRAAKANMKFSMKDYFLEDYPTITGSIIAVVLAVMILPEALGWKPELLNKVKLIFFFVGYAGSSLLLSLLSRADKAVNKVIDRKTNELDELKEENKKP